MLNNLWIDENGAIVSIEMVLIITIAVLALIVGWSEVAVAVNTELNDISNAVGALNQSYFFSGFAACTHHKIKSAFGGSQFHDNIEGSQGLTGRDLLGAWAPYRRRDPKKG